MNRVIARMCVGGLVGLVWLAGCGGGTDRDFSNATDPPNYQTVAPGGEAVGPSIDDHVCALAKVVGGFNSENSRVRVYADEQRGKWVLETSGEGTQSNLDVRAGMHCIAREDIAPYYSLDVNIDRQDFESSVDGAGTAATATGEEKPIKAVMGMRGKMNGVDDISKMGYSEEGERALVTTSGGSPRTSYGAAWTVSADTVRSVGGGGFGALGFRESSNFGGNFDDTEHFCTLTSIEGEFHSAADAVWLDLEGGEWRVTVASKCETKGGFVGLGSSCKEGHDIRVSVSCTRVVRRR